MSNEGKRMRDEYGTHYIGDDCPGGHHNTDLVTDEMVDAFCAGSWDRGLQCTLPMSRYGVRMALAAALEAQQKAAA